MAKNQTVDTDTGPAAAQRREHVVTVRLDSDMHVAATKRVAAYGLAAVLRALLRAYLRGEVPLTADDIQREMVPAPRRARKPRNAGK